VPPLQVNRLPSGQWALKLKVANERKHQILNPNMKMLLTAIDSITPDKYVFEYLQIEQLDAQQTNIQLGFPATLTHVIKPGSPMYNLSLEEMRTRMMEIIVFVDGVDSMTSKMMQVGWAGRAGRPGRGWAAGDCPARCSAERLGCGDAGSARWRVGDGRGWPVWIAGESQQRCRLPRLVARLPFHLPALAGPGRARPGAACTR
jgi:hypothetical protein